jgi:hypothetical protein
VAPSGSERAAWPCGVRGAHRATFLGGLHRDALVGILCLLVTAGGALFLAGRPAADTSGEPAEAS